MNLLFYSYCDLKIVYGYLYVNLKFGMLFGMKVIDYLKIKICKSL